MKLILASSSQRRQELMRMAQYDFHIIPSDADENIPLCPPGEYVKKLALKKAGFVYASHPDDCVIGADTIVELDGEIIGKPRDEADACAILSRLSGRTHTVYTGVSVLCKEKQLLSYSTAKVTFAKLEEAEIRAYVDTGDPMDKAGAYGVQGGAALFIERIEGCYFTVIGLPLHMLYGMLKQAGITPKWMKSRA